MDIWSSRRMRVKPSSEQAAKTAGERTVQGHARGISYKYSAGNVGNNRNINNQSSGNQRILNQSIG